MDNKSITKQRPREDMLFWRLTGSKNFIFSDGDVWKTQIQAVRRVLQTNVPVNTFVSLCHKMIGIMGDGGVLMWSDLSHRFALDVVGHAVMGHDFESLEKPHNSLVAHYHSVVSEITHPLYIAFPILERWLPRNQLRQRVDGLRDEFQRLLELKRENPGEDYVSFMLEQPPLFKSEFLDNVVTMFMTGHVRVHHLSLMRIRLMQPSLSPGHHRRCAIHRRLLPCQVPASPGSRSKGGHVHSWRVRRSIHPAFPRNAIHERMYSRITTPERSISRDHPSPFGL